MDTNKKSLALAGFVWLVCLAMAGCQSLSVNSTSPVSVGCNESLGTAFATDALTKLVSAKEYKKGDKVFVSDSGVPVTLAADMCLVKLKVGPGNPGPVDARSTSEGIGIEVWLPSPQNWNNRIRNYGGGGFVGGNHIYPDSDGSTIQKAVGSKFPAPVIAGMGYASATTDAGQRWSQNGSFLFLPDGKINKVLLADFSERSLVEQANKSKILVEYFYGKKPTFTYFDGHSTGGRQGWKIAQEHPELYDGYLLAAPAISQTKFSTNAFYPQVVMKSDLGFTSADPLFTASHFKQKVALANQRAVEVCDKEKLGFLIDPFACDYNPAKDATLLCTTAKNKNIIGKNKATDVCLSFAEANAINKFWYGIASDGSYDPKQTALSRSGKKLGDTQLWWSYPRGANWATLVSEVTDAERVAMILEDVRYAPSKQANPKVDIQNGSTSERDKWREIDYTALAQIYRRGIELQPDFANINTDQSDLSKLKALDRKVITYTGLAEDSIPPATSVNHYERVAATMGGTDLVNQFLRLYLVPGKAHSSQGRGYIVGSETNPALNNTVPLPKLPGVGNQSPTEEQDQMFTALRNWVEKKVAPDSILLTSRDGAVSYPICVYPKKITWNGVGSSRSAESYSCK